MHLFYTPGIDGSEHVLDEIESRHAVKVLRLKNGDRVNLVDGLGTWFEAIIIDGNPKKCRLEILSKKEQYKPLSYNLHIGISPTKNMDRFEWFVEKATEIGVTEITPLLCTHSERKKLRSDRIEKVIISAMKQSLKAYKPKLNQITPFSEWVKIPFEGSKAIGYCKDTALTPLWDLPAKNGLLMAIGPEGDFSEEEVKRAIKNDFKAVSLGESRLRTETAGVVSCSYAHLMFMK